MDRYSYQYHLQYFRTLSRDELEKIQQSLPKYGCGWHDSNYHRALRKALA